mmetsp:Transcript_41523/g.97575  ORF Transcript_41523/g.97575 Transcript_41523/m.97575 type:complete len:279 (+) Transcript_41523:228-1064(+)
MVGGRSRDRSRGRSRGDGTWCRSWAAGGGSGVLLGAAGAQVLEAVRDLERVILSEVPWLVHSPAVKLGLDPQVPLMPLVRHLVVQLRVLAAVGRKEARLVDDLLHCHLEAAAVGGGDGEPELPRSAVVGQHLVQHTPQHAGGEAEEGVGHVCGAEDGLVHEGERHVLKAEDLARVVIRHKRAVHTPDSDLARVLEEGGADHVVHFALEGEPETALGLDLVVQEVQVPLRGWDLGEQVKTLADSMRCARFDVEDLVFAVDAVQLRPQHEVGRHREVVSP